MDVFPGVPLGSTVSFKIYPSAIIDTVFSGCIMSAVYDYETANKFIDVHGIHLNVYPTLPSGTPNDPSQYDYVKVDLVSGQYEILGVPWIDESSIEVYERGKIKFTIEDMLYEDLNKISTLLSANGYTAMDWEYIR